MFFLDTHEEEYYCPICQSKLVHRDFRKRIMKAEGGITAFVAIERMKCTNDSCRRIHNVLPDFLVPYKQYTAEVISGVLDDVIYPDDIEDTSYPCETTMLRWKQWLEENRLRAEGYLRNIGHQFLNFGEQLLDSTVSLLDRIRGKSPLWLETVLRIIYNAGGWLEAI
jgi:hypothetical protein